MLKEEDLLGKPIIAMDSGKPVGSIARCVFDYHQQQLIAFVVNCKSLTLQVLPWSAVRDVNITGVTTHSPRMIVPAKEIFEVKRLLTLPGVTAGMCLQTLDKKALGIIKSTYFDKQTGNITGYEVIQEKTGKRQFVPAQPLVRIRDQVATIGQAQPHPKRLSMVSHR